MGAAVGALVKTAARTAVLELPGRAVCLPHGGVEDLGVARIHDEVDGAGLVVDVEDLAPRLATVRRLEHAALGIGLEDVAHRCGIHHVGIVGIDDEGADGVGIGQACRMPVVAGVFGAENAITGDDIAADVALARADLDHFRVGGRYRDGPDAVAGAAELVIRDVGPTYAVIHALPDAAVDRAHVEEIRLRGDPCDRDDAAADVGTTLRHWSLASGP